MSKVKTSFFVIFLVGTFFYFFNKKNQLSKSETTDPILAIAERKPEIFNDSTETKKTVFAVTDEKPNDAKAKEEAPDDPNFPNKNWEKQEIIDPDGVKHKMYKEKESTFDFNQSDKTVVFALELLKRKKGEDFTEEFERFKPVPSDFNGNYSMVQGNFRDLKTETELRLAFVVESDTQVPCFYSKDAGLFNGEKGMSIRTDEEGYGIFKIGPEYYARIMWSFEGERILHGYLYKKTGLSWSLLKIFNAKEVHMTKGEFLDKCKKLKISAD